MLATPGIRLLGARMLFPSAELRRHFVNILKEASNEDNVIDPYEDALIHYVDQSLTEETNRLQALPNRLMFLLLSGPDIFEKLNALIGENLPPPNRFGMTIRGTYGDYSIHSDGTVVTFEPAVLTAHTKRSNRKSLSLLAEFLETDGGVAPLSHSNANANVQTGFVMIKPDNFVHPSAVPGHIIDLFGTTGLEIVGSRVFSFSLKQARNFYGFLENVFVNKLAHKISGVLKNRLDSAFDFPISNEEYDQMASILKATNARCELNKILEYMTGLDPTSGVDDETPGPAKCFGLLFRGPDAISIIRHKLGATNPKQAEWGTIRGDYGKDLMRNAAHASDSLENANRERAIVGLVGDEPSPEKFTILDYLERTKD